MVDCRPVVGQVDVEIGVEQQAWLQRVEDQPDAAGEFALKSHPITRKLQAFGDDMDQPHMAMRFRTAFDALGRKRKCHRL